LRGHGETLRENGELASLLASPALVAGTVALSNGGSVVSLGLEQLWFLAGRAV
jgi:hypothetical protein